MATGTGSGARSSTSGPSTWEITLDLPAPLPPTSATRSPRRRAAPSACSHASVPVSWSKGTCRRKRSSWRGAGSKTWASRSVASSSRLTRRPRRAWQRGSSRHCAGRPEHLARAPGTVALGTRLHEAGGLEQREHRAARPRVQPSRSRSRSSDALADPSASSSAISIVAGRPRRYSASPRSTIWRRSSGTRSTPHRPATRAGDGPARPRDAGCPRPAGPPHAGGRRRARRRRPGRAAASSARPRRAARDAALPRRTHPPAGAGTWSRQPPGR